LKHKGHRPAQALQDVAVGELIDLLEITRGDIQISRDGLHGLVDIFLFEVNSWGEFLKISVITFLP
jgi:hypothetical protein